ncbi:MAG: chemotaxis protein CheA [Sphingomonadaceae bacterium]|nr:chemotaxis protein CheA [Sphingomonadaceae bacterium]
MDDLLSEFVAETREMLDALESEIVAWEQAPEDKARLDAIFRFVHTVKGNCGFFDLPRLAKLSHAAESALAEVRAGRRQPDTALVDAVLAVIDRIVAMVDVLEAGEDYPEGGDDALMAALEPSNDDGGEAAALRAQSATSGQASSTNRDGPRSIRLPVELLDRVMSGVSDMVLARNELARRLREYGVEPTIDGPFERLSAVLDDVRDGVTRMRMQRIEHLFNAFPRLVRDLSAELGKQVLIDVEGGEVELDREMVEMIRDPLTHIIRNAVDHGFETPAERIAASKREIGLLHISARQSGNRILIAISDDGRGIDTGRLADKAVASKVASPAEIAAMSETEKLALIFEPGISTAAAVTSISGRGVGMDVVRANIERVGGSIDVTSTPGKGTRILLSLPLTLSIIPALTIECCGQRYAIPRSYIEEIIHSRSGSAQLAQIGDAWLATIRGERIRCLTLAAVFGIDRQSSPKGATLILVRLAGGDFFALAVDRVLDHEELVIKPLAPAVMATGIYAGTSLLDDGSPVLMLDMAGIARKHDLISDVQRRVRRELPGLAQIASAEEGVPVLLFTGLDNRRRAVRLDVVNRVDKVEPTAVTLTDDGARIVLEDKVFPLAGVNRGAVPESRFPILRLSDGKGELAYAVQAIADSARIDGDISPAARAGEIEGIALVGGTPVEVLDCHWLFAREMRGSAALQPATCRFDGDDPWLDTILRPLAESAGYRVVSDDAQHADVVITTDSTASEAEGPDNRIRIVSDPDIAGQVAGTIYRYDRAGLLAALAQARMGRVA